MTEQRANEIFRTKYPNGEIGRPNSTSVGSKYWVIFDNSNGEGKVYGYAASSYVALLQRLGFKICYRADIQVAYTELDRMEKELAKGYEAFLDEWIFTASYTEMEEEWRTSLQGGINAQRAYIERVESEYIIV